jgi:hypothetical protein
MNVAKLLLGYFMANAYAEEASKHDQQTMEKAARAYL